LIDDRDSAEELLRAGEADAVAFGKLFIANPDLPQRFARNAPLNTPDPSTFYADLSAQASAKEGGPQGYTDYPALPG
jgi:2,4-dienoyl-CoA reductase-like NADH-dependent reductase (Old Yellow Enzyme family)